MKIGSNKERWQFLLVKPIVIGLLAGFGSLFTSSAAYAACALEGDVELIHLGGRNMIVYWAEAGGCNPDVVKYQTSSNNGQTWSDETILVTSTELAGAGIVDDFDGIFIVGKRGKLAATFNVIERENESDFPRLKVVTSNNFGRDWGDPILAWDITNDTPGVSNFADFLNCPSLESRSIPGSGVLSLLTTIVETDDSATAWVVTSRDSGQTWDDAQKLGDVAIPSLCDD